MAVDEKQTTEIARGPSCTCGPDAPPFDWSCPSHGQEAVDEWSGLREKRCVFCLIVDGTDKAAMVESGDQHIAFVPLGPHVPGHVLFVPRQHLPDATWKPALAAAVFGEAARYVRDLGVQANIITSIGPRATQSVPHLHVHVVPRWPRDGLERSWPWVIGPRKPPEQPMCQETHTGAWEDHCTLPLGHPSETAHVDERGHRWWDR